MLNHWLGLWRDPCWLGFKIIWNGFRSDQKIASVQSSITITYLWWWWIMQSWSISWNYWWVPLTLCPAHWGISIGSRTLVQKIMSATTTVHPHRGILIGSRTLYLLFKGRWSCVCIDKNGTIILTIIVRFPVSGCVIVVQAKALDSLNPCVLAKNWCVWIYPWVWPVDQIADIPLVELVGGKPFRSVWGGGLLPMQWRCTTNLHSYNSHQK